MRTSFVCLVSLFWWLATYSFAAQFEIVEGNFKWQEAKADAEARGGRLAVIDTVNKQQIIEELTSDVPSGRSLHTALYYDNGWWWQDGGQLDYDNWGRGEPSNPSSQAVGTFTTGGWGALTRGDWNDDSEGSQFWYILEIQTPQFQVIEGNFTWQEAKADAEAKGGRLAVLDTQEKIDAANAFVVEAGFSEDLWLGLTDQDSEGEWAWLNGEPLATADWGQRQPEGGSWGGQPENYAILHFGDRKWHDVPNNWGADYLLEILVQEPTPPVVELEAFYESNPQEEIVLDATPTEGFPAEFTYQWSFNDQPIPAFLGGAQPTFSLLGDQSQDGTWKVVVSNTVGTTEASFEYRMFVDNDSDGLSNYREENFTLTNPDLADSDADGLSDPDELSIHGTDPNIADVDEDGLNDSEEIAATTDPSVADTDNDGLLDGAEVKTYASNPKSGDTDNDGIADAAEVAAGLDINTAESIADAVAFLTQELANRPPVDGFEEAIAAARTTGREDVTSNPSLYSLYDQTAYNTVIAERDARLTLEEVKDGRLGSVLLLPDAQTNIVRLRFCIEESDELGQWITREEEAEVEIPLDPNKKFFRFSVKEDE